MALTAALIGGTVISSGLGIASALSANQQGNQEARGGDLAQLQDARNNEAYQQALNSLLIQQGRSGFRDSEGNELAYDPSTNTYTSKLGALPGAARQAQLGAQISRDTTDQTQANRVNEAAEGRSLRAATSAEPFLNQINNYRPVSGTELGGLLQERGAIATNDAYRPLIQQALTQAQRTGSAAGPIISDVGRQSSADLRKNAIDSMIAGKTGAADINAKNLGTLTGAYTALNANANPTLQFPGIQTDDTNKTMANMAAQRAQLSTSGLAAAGSNANTATRVAGLANDSIATPESNQQAATLKGLGDIFTPDKIKTIADLADRFGKPKTEIVNPGGGKAFG